VRLVLDTNAALSGLLWGGPPGRLIDAALAGGIELASSAALLTELQGVLLREKFAKQLARRGLTVGDVFDGYAALVVIARPAIIAPTVTRDPADNQVLAAALAARAALSFRGTRICSIWSASWASISSQPQPR
jgi:putative PIN family toxin of toxin-antitoxin system